MHSFHDARALLLNGVARDQKWGSLTGSKWRSNLSALFPGAILNHELNLMYKAFLRKMRFPIVFLVLLWIIQFVQWAGHFDFGVMGVLPKRVEGLPGILTSPLIHGSWGHLFSNTISFFMLSAVVFGLYPKIALRSFILLYLLSGLGVWIFADPFAYHIGASGIVYGMVSLVFWLGIFRRNAKSIVLALIVLVVYSGFFSGIFPGRQGFPGRVIYSVH